MGEGKGEKERKQRQLPLPSEVEKWKVLNFPPRRREHYNPPSLHRLFISPLLKVAPPSPLLLLLPLQKL